MMSAGLDRAVYLYRTERYEQSEQELRRLLAESPSDASAHALLGLCLAERLRFKEGTEEVQLAVGLAPDEPFMHYAMSLVQHKRGRHAEAYAAVMQAIALDPHDADYRAMHAQIRMDQREWSEALAAAEQGLAINPEHADCANLRAMALVQLGRHDHARQTIEEALAHDPANAVTHTNQGWAYLHRGEPKPALEHFREALRLDAELEWAQQGIVEAMKARYFLYRWMLRYFLWMGRMNRTAQWALIVGGYVGSRVLQQLAMKSPSLELILWPVLIAYVIFVLLSWLAVPMFNLMLCLNRFGRLVLPREKRIGAYLVGVLLLAAVSLGVTYLYWPGKLLLSGAIVAGLLMVPVSAVFNCATGWPRWTMAGIALALAAVGAGSILVDALPPNVIRGNPFFPLFLFGMLASMFAANALAAATVKK